MRRVLWSGKESLRTGPLASQAARVPAERACASQPDSRANTFETYPLSFRFLEGQTTCDLQETIHLRPSLPSR